MFAIPVQLDGNEFETYNTVFLPVFSLSLSKNAAINALLLAYNLSFSSLIADSSTMPTLHTKF